MRALEPMQSGFVDRDGVAIHYEVYGDGSPTVYLLMPDTIVESRGWKAQIPFLARSFRVVVSDPRGNGGSEAPDAHEGYADRLMIDDAWAVLDAVGAEQAVLVGLCTGAGYVVLMAAEAPERVLGICAINPGLQLSPPLPHKVAFDFDTPRDVVRGLAEDEPPLLAGGLAGFRAVLLRGDVSRAALDQTASRTASGGRCRRPPRR